MRAYGSDPISYSTIQPGMSYYDTSFGYIAFVKAFRFDITLGAPICAESERADMIRRFLSAKRRPLFCYVDANSAALVREFGGPRFHSCGMGIDRVLPLDAAPAGYEARVAGALKKAVRAGFGIVEARFSELSEAQRARLASITGVYLKRSAVPVEMRFMNRPFSCDDDGLSRMFLLQQGTAGEIFGYAVLDPYFDKYRVIGYLLNLLRFEPTRLWGVYYSTVTALASLLRGEGIRQLSLGFCPLAGISTEGSSPALSGQMQWLARQCAGVAYFNRLREQKEAFGGLTPQRYFVTPSAWLAPAALAFLRACGAPFTAMVAPKLYRAAVAGSDAIRAHL